MPNPFEVTIDVDAGHRTGAYRPIWNWFGYDEPNYTYTDDGKKLLGQLAELSREPVRMRTHNLLTSGDGTAALKWGSTNAYTEDANGNPVYDWTIMDQIFDAYVEADNMPFVQVGFMPEALSDDPGPYQHIWAPARPLQQHHDRLGHAAQRSQEVGRPGRGLGPPPRRSLRHGQGRDLALGSAGTSPTATTGRAPSPNSATMYDVNGRRPSAASSPRPASAARTPAAPTRTRRRRSSCANSSQHVVDHRSPLDFVGFHAKGKPVVYEDHVRMGLAQAAPRHRRQPRRSSTSSPSSRASTP